MIRKYFRVDISFEANDYNTAISLLLLLEKKELKEQSYSIEVREEKVNE